MFDVDTSLYGKQMAGQLQAAEIEAASDPDSRMNAFLKVACC